MFIEEKIIIYFFVWFHSEKNAFFNVQKKFTIMLFCVYCFALFS